MADDSQTAVRMVLTPAPELLPVVQGFVDRLAEQKGFTETQRLSLKQGLEQVCRRMVEAWQGEPEAELKLEFQSFGDRLEIIVEGKNGSLAEGAADLPMLNQLMDRVLFEEPSHGQRRLRLVKYRSRGSGRT